MRRRRALRYIRLVSSTRQVRRITTAHSASSHAFRRRADGGQFRSRVPLIDRCAATFFSRAGSSSGRRSSASGGRCLPAIIALCCPVKRLRTAPVKRHDSITARASSISPPRAALIHDARADAAAAAISGRPCGYFPFSLLDNNTRDAQKIFLYTASFLSLSLSLSWEALPSSRARAS